MTSLFVIITILIIVMILMTLLYLLYSKQFLDVKKQKYNFTFISNDVETLNHVWNEDPDRYKDTENGYKDCLLFLHYFDPVVNIDNLLNPKNTANLRDLIYILSISSMPQLKFLLPMIPALKIYTDSISFCTYNKYLNFKHYFMKEDGMGFVFCYKNAVEFSVSPLCFYDKDGGTLIRTNGGCGGVGWQTPLPVNKNGYGSKHINKGKLFGHEKSNPPLSFKEFIEKTHVKTGKKRDESAFYSHNEVVIKNWYSIENPILPFAGLFITKNYAQNIEKKEMLKKIANKISKETSENCPVFEFDCDPINDKPFKYLD